MTLSELLARLDDVEETPDGYLVHCPAHADSQQSLRLSVSEAGKVLLKCRAGCETKDVVAALGLTMRQLATMKPGDVDTSRRAVSTALPATPAAIASLALRIDGYAQAWREAPEAAEATRYAHDRFGLDAVAVDRLGLGYTEDLGGGPRLVVPFRTPDGVARNFQARALDKDVSVRWLGPKSPEGGSWSKIGFFPGDSGWDEVLICEGPGDALTGAALGYDTIGVAGASHAGNPAIVSEIASWIGDRQAVIAGDGDPAGRRFSAQLAEGLAALDVRVRVLHLPDGVDLNDWRLQNPAAFARDVIRAISHAEPVKSRTAALLAWDEDRYSLTDLGAARYLRDYIESQGSGVRYSEEVGFFLLEGGVWRRDERQGVRTHAQAVADLVRDLARTASGEAAREGAMESDKKRAARLNRYAAHAQTSRGLDSMLRELQAVKGVPASIDEFDRHPDLLACLNGVIDLRTGTLRPHDPTLLLTRRVEFDYDPGARADRWESFLQEVFPKYPDLPAFLRRFVGYGITGHTSEQCFGVHWGKGANGKSIFTDTLTEVFREQTVTTGFSTFEERSSGGIPNDLAALKGARLVMAAEGEQGRPMAEAVLKRVTGRDLISARFMRKEFFEFRPTFLLMLATNFRPSFKGQDEGLWRRVKLIPWERYFQPEERDHRLGEKLLAEAPGILAWAVRGAREWYAGGLQDPDVIRSSTREYRETSDALAGFLPGVFVKDDAAGRVDGKILFDAYLEWADEENLPQREIWTRRTFFGALEERGLTKRKTNKGIAFDGVRKARLVDREPDHDQPEVPEPGKAGQDFLRKPEPAAPAEIPRLTGATLDGIV
ncbi:phage/plasmid primase, P4 family [Herbiconiux moechotypicola]|uniref:DNA primase/helicase n=1 Tax=Herbiconiux moechotypicola TaxID=637393 RepID=A0ABN3DG69_9MICO|nr:phage/plasmid primase, P4 family [Herbiconiux moechotypicola]MCS5729517.1 phage/plasmid primase, P4 family [Herbiconiux moechotypicola]